jgi:hypothetical protein
MKNKIITAFVTGFMLSVLFTVTVNADSVVKRKKTYATNQTTTEITTETTTAETTTETTTVETTTETTTEDTDITKLSADDVMKSVEFRNENTPAISETETKNDTISTKIRECFFENGNHFWQKRYTFDEESDVPFTTGFYIEGDSIEIRFVDPDTKEWVNTTNPENIKFSTLFIDTDKKSMVLGVPAVYKNAENHTLDIQRELESCAKIEKEDGRYKITLSYPQNPELICEIWGIESSSKLFDWSNPVTFDSIYAHDLSIERRWCWDGYYFKTPSTYVPSGDNIIYRHSSNYTGASLVKYRNLSTFADNMGYVMTKICMKNQNEQGYWETIPKSSWLESDFNIEENFYDTRFNTDFARSLVNAYNSYGDREFIESAVKYSEYFFRHASKNHYEPVGGGWLVEDYASFDGTNSRTHVSLNHQLAEIDFLYEIYGATGYNKYKILADTMLEAVDSTKDLWVRDDNNLNYCLMYYGTANTMVDYPYLTYNDLYNTKELLSQFGETNETIEYLMSCKKEWMDSNGIKSYTGYTEPVKDAQIIDTPEISDVVISDSADEIITDSIIIDEMIVQ